MAGELKEVYVRKESGLVITESEEIVRLPSLSLFCEVALDECDEYQYLFPSVECLKNHITYIVRKYPEKVYHLLTDIHENLEENDAFYESDTSPELYLIEHCPLELFAKALLLDINSFL